jgi:hypothetical protein
MSRHFFPMRTGIAIVFVAASLMCMTSMVQASLYEIQGNEIISSRFIPGSPPDPFNQAGTPSYSGEYIASVHSWGGEAVMPTITADFSTDKTFRVRLKAPLGYRYNVIPPTGARYTYLLVQLSSADEHYLAYGQWVQRNYAFTGLSGSVLAQGDNAAYYSKTDGSFGLYTHFLINGPYSFSALEIAYTVPAGYIETFDATQPSGSGVVIIAPLPFDAVDPGPWVTLVELPPQDMGRDIIDTIATFGLPYETMNSLISKLDNIVEALDNGNLSVAIDLLESFMHQVQAQRGKKLTEAQADMLLEASQELLQLLAG